MYERKRSKVCPFCQSKIKRVDGTFKCGNCGAVIKPEVLDTKSLNSHFFNGQR